MLFLGPALLLVAAVDNAILRGTSTLACLQPDSWGYVTDNYMRTQGYQLLLNLVVLIFGDLRWAGVVQLNLMLSSYVALGFATRQLFNSNLAGLAVLAVLSLSAQLYDWYPQIMTESLFIALVGFHIAVVIHLVRHYSDRLAVLSGVTVAAMLLVRPNGISFMAGLPVLMILLPRYSRRLLALGVSPVVVGVVLQASFNYFYQGFFGLTLFQGPQLVATYGELITSDMPSQYPQMASILAERLRPLYSRYPKPEDRSFPFEYGEILAATVTPAQYVLGWPAMITYADDALPESSPIVRAGHVDRMGVSLVLSGVVHNPRDFVKTVASGYAMYWGKHSLQTAAGIDRTAAACYASSVEALNNGRGTFVGVMDVTPYSTPGLAQSIEYAEHMDQNGPRTIEIPWRWFTDLRLRYPARALVFLLSWTALLGLLFRRIRDPLLGIWAYLGASLHAGYLLLSVANASMQRYAAPFDVAMVIMLATLALALRGLLDVCRRQTRPDLLSPLGRVE